MSKIYYVLGFITFWLLIIVALYFIWEVYVKKTRFGDWIFAVKTWITIWFRKDVELIERELHFVDTAYSDKAKKRWEHIVIVTAYKIKLSLIKKIQNNG